MSADTPPGGWSWDPAALAAALEAAGFDVDPRGAATPEGGGLLSARRERGDRVLVLRVDAGGRVRVSSTTVIDESSRRVQIAGAPSRVITTLQRSVRLVATLPDPTHFADLLAALDLIPWQDEVGTIGGATAAASDGP